VARRLVRSGPFFVLASIYLYFFTYFLMEYARPGLPVEHATELFIDLLSCGLWRSNGGKAQ
jgi:hypothetical protein